MQSVSPGLTGSVGDELVEQFVRVIFVARRKRDDDCSSKLLGEDHGALNLSKPVRLRRACDHWKSCREAEECVEVCDEYRVNELSIDPSRLAVPLAGCVARVAPRPRSVDAGRECDRAH